MSDTIEQELRNLHQAIGGEPTTETKASMLLDGLIHRLHRAIQAAKAAGATAEMLLGIEELHDHLSRQSAHLAAAVATPERHGA